MAWDPYCTPPEDTPIATQGVLSLFVTYNNVICNNDTENTAIPTQHISYKTPFRLNNIQTHHDNLPCNRVNWDTDF